MTKLYVFTLSVLAFGCGDRTRAVSPVETPASAPAPHVCQIPAGYDFESAPFQALSVDLERHYQKRRYYSCSGSFLSESEDTVKSPVKKVNVAVPLPGAPRMECEFFDKTSCDHAGLIDVERNDNVTDFRADYSYGIFNIHVQSGENIVGLNCALCSEVAAGDTCAQGASTHFAGNVTLDVNYKEVHLDQADVYPDPSTCH